MTPKSKKRKETRLEREKNNLCIYCGIVEPVLNKKGCKNCAEKHKIQSVKSSSKHKDRSSLYRKKVKQATINKYGGKCKCCEESELYFLTIDHINNNGGMERKSYYDNNHGSAMSFYLELLRNDIRNDLQVLCFNCNMGKNINGGICPHIIPSPKSFEKLEDLRTIPQYNTNCKIAWPNDDELLKMIREKNVSQVAKILNVHMTAIIGRLKRRNLYPIKKEN